MKLSALDKSVGLITLDGILSADREDSLKSIISEAIQQGMKNIILDFSPLNHMNSAGASTLVKLAVLAKRQKMRLCAFRLNKRYQEIFDLTGLSEGITKFNETAEELEGLSKAEVHQLKEMTVGEGEQDDIGWAPNIVRLQAAEKPQEAMNKNVDRRRLTGPLQGFGPMWQKTYSLTINKPGLQPHDVITAMKQHLPEFQPTQNRFYPSSQGIAAGEIVLIDSSTPGGIVSTGVLVLYADDVSFTLMTPQGHPEAGWVTFSAKNREDAVEMQIQGLARAADPLYEFAFRIVGSKFQETIWKHVLSSLASYIGMEANVQMAKTCVGADLQWTKTGNLWYNAQIRSLPYNIPRLFGRHR
jgi:anti-anti-sigma factor